MSAAGVCATAPTRAEANGLLRVRCEVNGDGRECRILDLSPNRAFVESFVPPVTGSRINLQFHLPDGHKVLASGVVSYHQFRVGFGVDFTDLSSQDCERINSFVG
ncbi:MAG TPA: PilZ domain-containing protein [Blastocatellia bacterium]|jgi:hypothetical protein